MKRLVCLLIALSLMTSPVRSGGALNDILTSLPSWDSYQAMLHADDANDDSTTPSMTSDYGAKLNELFRFANLKNTAVGEMLENGGFSTQLNSLAELSVDAILKMFEDALKERSHVTHNYDIEMREADVGSFVIGQSDASAQRSVLGRTRKTFENDPEYWDCYKDYSTIADPATTRVARSFGSVFLTNLFADIDDQDVFCEQACEALCDFTGACFPGAELACNSACNAANFTRLDEVEVILDFFFPEVEAQSWGRRSK